MGRWPAPSRVAGWLRLGCACDGQTCSLRPARHRLLGLTVVGEHAGDPPTACVPAMKHGLALNKILGTVRAHLLPRRGRGRGRNSATGSWQCAHLALRVLQLHCRVSDPY